MAEHVTGMAGDRLEHKLVTERGGECVRLLKEFHSEYVVRGC